MEIPHRILRAQAKDIDPTLRNLTAREIDRQARIVKVAQTLFVRHGRHNITFRGLAIAMKMATATLRKHFTCLDALLAEILQLHLMHISAALGEIPPDAPDRPQALRAAYLAATRNGLGAFTEAHHLFVHQRQTLPPDELATIDDIHAGIGHLLGGPSPLETLSFLDNPCLDTPRIETLLATYTAPRPQPAPIFTRPAPLPAPKPPAKLPDRHPDDVYFMPGLPTHSSAPPPPH